MVFGDFKGADGALSDKAFNIAKSQKFDGYHCGLASMVYKSFL